RGGRSGGRRVAATRRGGAPLGAVGAPAPSDPRPLLVEGLLGRAQGRAGGRRLPHRRARGRGGARPLLRVARAGRAARGGGRRGPMTEALDAAVNAAREAGELLLSLSGALDPSDIEEKSKNDLVSRADKESEALIRRIL